MVDHSIAVEHTTYIFLSIVIETTGFRTDIIYPLWYNGHLVSVNYPYQRNLDQMAPLGQKAGYQHLWLVC